MREALVRDPELLVLVRLPGGDVMTALQRKLLAAMQPGGRYTTAQLAAATGVSVRAASNSLCFARGACLVRSVKADGSYHREGGGPVFWELEHGQAPAVNGPVAIPRREVNDD